MANQNEFKFDQRPPVGLLQLLANQTPPGGLALLPPPNKLLPAVLLQPQAAPSTKRPTTTRAPPRLQPQTEPTETSQLATKWTQNYWLQPQESELECSAKAAPSGRSLDCNLRGLCNDGVCSCFAGFSGPTCALGKPPKPQPTRRTVQPKLTPPTRQPTVQTSARIVANAS